MTRSTVKLFVGKQPRSRAIWVLLLLVSIDLFLSFIYLLTYEGGSFALSEAFHLDREYNIPSTYSAIQLILAGLAVFVCISVDTRSRLSRSLPSLPHLWFLIGSVLVMMGIDEYLTYHERLGHMLYRLGVVDSWVGGQTTIAGYAWPWTVYGAAFALIVGVPAALLTRRAFSRHRYLFRLLLLAGLVFVTGALGFENLRVYSIHYQGAMAANMLVTLEETCEMIAISLVAFVFLRYREERLLEMESVTEPAAVTNFSRDEVTGS